MKTAIQQVLGLLLAAVIVTVAWGKGVFDPLRDAWRDLVGPPDVIAPADPATLDQLAHDLALIESILVRDEFVPGYNRDLFGQRWTDDVDVPGGHDGCGTRDGILARDLTNITIRPDTNGCVVETGTLTDPYTGDIINFQKTVNASDVQIDHIVPLSWAWQQGANTWTEQQRTNFANDPINLQATAGWANQVKSDDGPAGWLPTNVAYRCEYVHRFVSVVATYGLDMKQADQTMIEDILTACLG